MYIKKFFVLILSSLSYCSAYAQTTPIVNPQSTVQPAKTTTATTAPKAQSSDVSLAKDELIKKLISLDGTEKALRATISKKLEFYFKAKRTKNIEMENKISTEAFNMALNLKIKSYQSLKASDLEYFIKVFSLKVGQDYVKAKLMSPDEIKFVDQWFSQNLPK